MATVKNEQSVTKETKEKAPECAFSAYIGPNRIGAFTHVTLFPCCREKALKLPEVALAIEKYPEIKDQIVPGDDLHKYI